MTGHDARVMSAVFSRDDAHVVTASDDNSARVWEVSTGASAAVLTGHTAWVEDAAFSPNGEACRDRIR